MGEIKEIRGFIYYPAQKSTQSILADRISLMRYHATDTLFNVDKESLQTDDKAIKKDTVPGKPVELKKQDERKTVSAVLKCVLVQITPNYRK